MLKATARPKDKAALPDRRRITFFRRRLLRWTRKNYSIFPWRGTHNSFHALAAEVMLQRTKAEQVAPVYAKFVRRFPTPERASRANYEVFHALLQPLGLKWRARALRKLATALSKRGGAVPYNSADLKKLPGVGDYAASAYASFHLDIPATIIDANIVRLYGRFFGFPTGPETRRSKQFRTLADHVRPSKQNRQFAYGLLDFTRAVCTPRPHCGICPLRTKCKFTLERR